MAQWMIENGSDLHQGGDGPLMRAALAGMRIPMMELLVAHVANANALWNGSYPIICVPCETRAAIAYLRLNWNSILPEPAGAANSVGLLSSSAKARQIVRVSPSSL
jgi:hypothetical protein